MGIRKKWGGLSVNLILVLSLIGCGASTPIRIGFLAALTGPLAGLGVSGRDGAILAVEDINSAGGIQGRDLELLVFDDRYDPEAARQAIDQMREQGTVAGVGLMISAEVEAVYEQINRDGFVLVSPTATSTNFTGKKDYFFRVVADTGSLGSALGDWVYKSGVRKIVGVYELANRAYAENLLLAAEERFRGQGGEVGAVFSYRSGESDLSDLAAQIAAETPEAVILSSPAPDTALLAQYIRAENSAARIFSVPWAQTSELLEKGGRAVYGMELLALYDPGNPNEDFQAFAQRFEKRFGRAPDFGATYSYEALMVLAETLRQTDGSPEQLRRKLVEIGDFSGVQSAIHLDEFGDSRRSLYVMRVVDGYYQIVATIPPEEE
jgi:branched-chain amino acid transport system substrate-binding protein